MRPRGLARARALGTPPPAGARTYPDPRVPLTRHHEATLDQLVTPNAAPDETHAALAGPPGSTRAILPGAQPQPPPVGPRRRRSRGHRRAGLPERDLAGVRLLDAVGAGGHAGTSSERHAAPRLRAERLWYGTRLARLVRPVRPLPAGERQALQRPGRGAGPAGHLRPGRRGAPAGLDSQPRARRPRRVVPLRRRRPGLLRDQPDSDAVLLRDLPQQPDLRPARRVGRSDHRPLRRDEVAVRGTALGPGTATGRVRRAAHPRLLCPAGRAVQPREIGRASC